MTYPCPAMARKNNPGANLNLLGAQKCRPL